MSSSVIVLAPPHEFATIRFSDRSYARFADELQSYSGWCVSFAADVPESDDGTSFLISQGQEPPAWIMSMELVRRQRILERLTLIRCARTPSVLVQLEQWGVASAIETLAYSMWENPRNETTGYGIVGRGEVVSIIGAEAAPAPFANSSYCVFGSAKSNTLTQALAEYLEALARLRAERGAGRE